MTERSYAISGAGFTLQGTIEAERIDLLVRLLDRVARDLALASVEITDHEAYGAMVHVMGKQ